jgi:PAS domain S-box-containing protein
MAGNRKMLKPVSDASGTPSPGPIRAERKGVGLPRTAERGRIGGDGIEDRFFRQVIANMRNGVLAITADGRIAVMNAEACRIFGLKARPSDVGRPYAQVLREHPDILRVLSSAFELEHLPNRAELRLKATDKVIGYTLSRVRDERGRTTGATLFFKDLTRVEQLEERERLRDRLAALGEMAAAIAHEVKNPLAGIEVMAGLLKRRIPDSKDAQSILNDIINEAKQANAIVLEVLEFVRPIRLEVEHTSIADVLQQAVTTAESKAQRGETAVRMQVKPDLPLIHGDQHQLVQLFTNLIINAFEALDGEGTVSIVADQAAVDDEHVPVDASAAGPFITVDVLDDGPGVPPDLRDRIFNAFFTTKAQGSGLGLAIVRKVVDAHDGRIDVMSESGRGTRFRVMLPVAGAHQWFT